MSNEPKEGSVTAPQEPLKLTMFLLTRTTWTDSTVIGLYFDETKARTEADRLEAAKGQGDGWREYYVNPIEVADAPARDDAAELRAALEAAERALDRAGASLLHDNYEQQERAYKKLQAAHDEVRAALVAPEGQP